MNILQVVTSKKCLKYVKSRGLEKQFLKAIDNILQ